MFCLAAAELDRMASVYDHIGGALGYVGELSGPYDAALRRAEDSGWDSDSGKAFRSAVAHLRGEGGSVAAEARELADEARIIAADLRTMAEQARTVARLLAATAGVAVSLLPEVIQEALAALGDPAGFVRFLNDHGGIPPILYTVGDVLSALTGSAD